MYPLLLVSRHSSGQGNDKTIPLFVLVSNRIGDEMLTLLASRAVVKRKC
jgi:hypothetical protein